MKSIFSEITRQERNAIILNNSRLENAWKKTRFQLEFQVEQIRILLPGEDRREGSVVHASIHRNKLNRVTGSRSLKCGVEEELRSPVPLSRVNDNLGTGSRSREESLNFKGTRLVLDLERERDGSIFRDEFLRVAIDPSLPSPCTHGYECVVTPCFARDDRMTR